MIQKELCTIVSGSVIGTSDTLIAMKLSHSDLIELIDLRWEGYRTADDGMAWTLTVTWMLMVLSGGGG
jgi:hypothetical protein